MIRITLLALLTVPVFGGLVTVNNCPGCTVTGGITGFGTALITLNASLASATSPPFSVGSTSITENETGYTTGPVRPGYIEITPIAGPGCDSETDGSGSAGASFTIGGYSGGTTGGFGCLISGSGGVFQPFTLGESFPIDLFASVVSAK
jgi:hypothetical protein